MNEDLAWSAARQLAYTVAEPLAPVELSLADAIGTVLAAPLVALAPLPAFDTVAMDGFAVRGPGPWRLCGRQLAGGQEPAELDAGQAVEVGTGAVLPPGAEGVLPYEDAARAGDVVAGDASPGRHVRRAGEECAAGEELMGAGAVVTAPAAGLAAAVGYDRLLVRPRPRVDLLVSGDELMTCGLPGHGRIRDALGPQLPALVTGLGGRPGPVRYLPDRPGPLADAIAEGSAEVVVTTGGSSVGPADHLPRVLVERGARVLVRGVACRPGHPQLLAELPDGRWLVGLPGNPLAALSGVMTLLAPLLARLGGHRMPQGGHLPFLGGTGLIRPHASLTRLVPVAIDVSGRAVQRDYHGSAMLRGVAGADGLAVVPPGSEVPQIVEVLALPR